MSDEETGAVDTAQPVAAPEVSTAQDEPWTASLPDEWRKVAETKGWENPARAIESYHNLEKLRGVPAERLVTIPEDGGDMSAVWDKLGRPAEADAYSNALGEDFADDTFRAAASKAHELGLTDSQFAGMQEWLKGTTTNIEAQRREQLDASFGEWSQANPAALQNVQRMMAAVGADEAAVDAALQGDKSQLFDVLGKVAARMSEGRAVNGESGEGFTMSKAAAEAKRAKLYADKTFMDRFTSENARVRGPAIQEMNDLAKIIAGDS